VNQIRDAGGKAEFVQADVTSADDVKELVSDVVRRCGRLDCAFNNAGMVGEFDPIAEASDDEWADVIETNLSSVYYCVKYEILAMLDYGGGTIVNNASILGHRGNPLYGAAYVASKHGVIGLTRQVALQYASQGIRVNAVSPGVIDTPMAAEAQADPVLAEMVRNWHPMGRIGEPEEVADSVIWLSSRSSSFVTGHSLVIDGGGATNFGFNAQAPGPFDE
jgi:NAD(P)-dependent dehydrogenase (short-subunit alcohol dehydrogenase family)